MEEKQFLFGKPRESEDLQLQAPSSQLNVTPPHPPPTNTPNYIHLQCESDILFPCHKLTPALETRKQSHWELLVSALTNMPNSSPTPFQRRNKMGI